METNQFHLKSITTVPNLKAAVGTSASSERLTVFSSDANSFHIASADDSLKSFGGITVTGPGVSAQSIDPTLWLNLWLAVKGLKFGSGGWGPVGTKCKMSVTFSTNAPGEITAAHANWICTPTLG